MSMNKNKTAATRQNVTDFLKTVSDDKAADASTLIDIMQKVSKLKPVMWGPSIIGFGTQHYKYESGREGDMPILAFSPRKSAITIYFSEGFNHYGDLLPKLGKYKTSLSCLYISKLSDIDLSILTNMLRRSFEMTNNPAPKPSDVDAYIASVPDAAKKQFEQLRSIVKKLLPHAQEVVSYGIIGYKLDDKRAKLFISGFRDHVAIYPVPKDSDLQAKLVPYIKGKGTLWFDLNQPLPIELIDQVVKALAEA